MGMNDGLEEKYKQDIKEYRKVEEMWFYEARCF